MADPVALELSRLGSFDPAAYTLTRDSDGLYWARSAPKALGALEPDTGQAAARIALPYRVYNHVLAADGIVYVTHHTLTAEGFTVSVVDTRARKLLREIRGIAGLRTGLAVSGSAVFMTTTDVGKPGYLHLYRIDTATHELTELRRADSAGSCWLLSGEGDTLLLVRTPRPGRPAEAPGASDTAGASVASVERLDLVTGRTVGAQSAAAIAPLARRMGEPLIAGGEIFVPLQEEGGRWAIARLDQATLARRDFLPLSYSIQRIVGRHGSMLVYLDGPEPAFGPGMTLHFYDLEGRKEVKSVNIPFYLRSNPRND